MALAAKAAPAPAAATMAPPIAGPTLRVRLKLKLFNVTAAGRRARGTRSPTVACQDGLLRAVPHPIRKVNVSRSHGVIKPAQLATVSATDTQSMKHNATSMTAR